MNIPTLIATIVVSGFFLFVIFAIIKHVIFASAFKIDLKLSTGDMYKAGEQIRGTVSVSVKKQFKIDALKISLFCVSTSEKENTRDMQIIFQQDVVVSVDFDLYANSPVEFPFSINVPEKVTPRGITIGTDSPDLPGTKGGGGAPYPFNTNVRQPRWYVQASIVVGEEEVVKVQFIHIIR